MRKNKKSAGADYILTAVQWPTYFIPMLMEQSTINTQKQDLTVVLQVADLFFLEVGFGRSTKQMAVLKPSNI